MAPTVFNIILCNSMAKVSMRLKVFVKSGVMTKRIVCAALCMIQRRLALKTHALAADGKPKVILSDSSGTRNSGSNSHNDNEGRRSFSSGIGGYINNSNELEVIVLVAVSNDSGNSIGQIFSI